VAQQVLQVYGDQLVLLVQTDRRDQLGIRVQLVQLVIGDQLVLLDNKV
jgi:hypothetical protein